jgi:hypothetical protein
LSYERGTRTRTGRSPPTTIALGEACTDVPTGIEAAGAAEAVDRRMVAEAVWLTEDGGRDVPGAEAEHAATIAMTTTAARRLAREQTDGDMATNVVVREGAVYERVGPSGDSEAGCGSAQRVGFWLYSRYEDCSLRSR